MVRALKGLSQSRDSALSIVACDDLMNHVCSNLVPSVTSSVSRESRAAPPPPSPRAPDSATAPTVTSPTAASAAAGGFVWPSLNALQAIMATGDAAGPAGSTAPAATPVPGAVNKTSSKAAEEERRAVMADIRRSCSGLLFNLTNHREFTTQLVGRGIMPALTSLSAVRDTSVQYDVVRAWVNMLTPAPPALLIPSESDNSMIADGLDDDAGPLTSRGGATGNSLAVAGAGDSAGAGAVGAAGPRGMHVRRPSVIGSARGALTARGGVNVNAGSPRHGGLTARGGPGHMTSRPGYGNSGNMSARGTASASNANGALSARGPPSARGAGTAGNSLISAVGGSSSPRPGSMDQKPAHTRVKTEISPSTPRAAVDGVITEDDTDTECMTQRQLQQQAQQQLTPAELQSKLEEYDRTVAERELTHTEYTPPPEVDLALRSLLADEKALQAMQTLLASDDYPVYSQMIRLMAFLCFLRRPEIIPAVSAPVASTASTAVLATITAPTTAGAYANASHQPPTAPASHAAVLEATADAITRVGSRLPSNDTEVATWTPLRSATQLIVNTVAGAKLVSSVIKVSFSSLKILAASNLELKALEDRMNTAEHVTDMRKKMMRLELLKQEQLRSQSMSKEERRARRVAIVAALTTLYHSSHVLRACCSLSDLAQPLLEQGVVPLLLEFVATHHYGLRKVRLPLSSCSHG